MTATDATSLPVGVVAVFSCDCTTSGLTNRHRVVLHRDGTVTTPDHSDEVSTAVMALGGRLDGTCGHWRDAADGNRELPRPAPPSFLTWQLDGQPGVWTPAALSTGRLAMPVYQLPTDPGTALPYLQAFLRTDGSTRVNLSRQLEMLLTPQTRDAAYRRTRATTVQEVVDLLDAGCPLELVADLACLDFTAEDMRAMRPVLRERGAPVWIVAMMGELLTPGQVTRVVAAWPETLHLGTLTERVRASLTTVSLNDCSWVDLAVGWGIPHP